jgi:hypothetical protein
MSTTRPSARTSVLSFPRRVVVDDAALVDAVEVARSAARSSFCRRACGTSAAASLDALEGERVRVDASEPARDAGDPASAS